jgi:hypothetical protein
LQGSANAAQFPVGRLISGIEGARSRRYPRSPCGYESIKASLNKTDERECAVPQQAWSQKRERQYAKVKSSQKKQGKSEKTAKRIASATVNKARARSGESRTASRSSTRDMSSGKRGGQRSGTNRPKGRTKEQLYNEAKRRGIKGRSKMSKAQLQRALGSK